VVPPTKTQEDKCDWVVGPLPVLQTLRDKEPFSRHGGLQKERVIVPRAGRRHRVIEVSGSDAPASRSWEPIIEEHIQDLCSVWFIVSGQSWVEFSLVSSSWSTSSRVSTLGTLSRPNF
jgi:hypothetical protein